MTTCSNCGQAIEGQAAFCPSCGTQVVASGLEDSLLGRTLNGKYRLLKKIGSGSMGTVYLGEHLGLHKKVALKILRPDLNVSEESLQRFQREGIAAGRFSHPNAIQIFDFDRAEQRVFYLAMELVEGSNLKEFLREEELVSPVDAVHIARQILGALAEAHEHGIVHRDLKPENVMVTRGAEDELGVKVLDFGLSKLIQLPLGASMATQTGQIMGTPMYMAPEQGSGEEVDARSDLYAVGLILYELVSGQPPFRADNLTQLFIKQATEPVPSLIESRPELPLPHALDEVLERALEKDREERFQSAAEMLAALDEVDFDRLASATGRRKKKKPKKPAARRAGSKTTSARWSPRWAAAAAVLLLAGGAFTAWKTGILAADGAHANVARVSMKAEEERSEEEVRYVRLLGEARRSARIGETNAALTWIEQAHDLACRDSEAFLVRALVSRARDDDDAALADLEQALEIDPSYAAAAAGIGWILLDRADVDGALVRFDEAARFDADSAEAAAGRGVVAYLREDAARARELLLRARDLDPDEPRAALYLGRVFLDEQDHDAAIETLVRAKLNDPLSWEAYAALGQAYLAAGRTGDAETQLREAVARGPDELGALTDLGSLLVHTERYLEALELLDAALRKHPDWGRPRALLAMALGDEGRIDEAIDALERAVDEGEGDARVLTLLGIQLQRKGEHAAAIERFDAAIGLDATYALPHLNKGLALFALDRFEPARVELELAVDLDPDSAFTHYSLGVLHMDYVGGRDQAREHLAEYEQLDGSDPRVEQWLRELGG